MDSFSRANLPSTNMFQERSFFFEERLHFITTLWFHKFILSLLLLIRCILSLSQAFVNNTEFGGDQMFLILYCLKKPVKERENTSNLIIIQILPLIKSKIYINTPKCI